MKHSDDPSPGLVPSLDGFGRGRKLNRNILLREILGRLIGKRHHVVLARANNQPLGALFENVLGFRECDSMGRAVDSLG